MAKEKKGFILYADQKDLFNQLSNEKAGVLIKHIYAYVNDENPRSNDVLINIAFTPIKQHLKRDLKKFEDKKRARAEAGRLGGLAKASNAKQELANLADNVNGNVTVKEKVINIEARKLAFKNKIWNEFKDKYKLETLKAFYEYWTEHGDNDKKMRFEKEKSFGMSRRLSTWAKNDFDKTEKPEEEKGKGEGGVSMEELYNANN